MQHWQLCREPPGPRDYYTVDVTLSLTDMGDMHLSSSVGSPSNRSSYASVQYYTVQSYGFRACLDRLALKCPVCRAPIMSCFWLSCILIRGSPRWAVRGTATRPVSRCGRRTPHTRCRADRPRRPTVRPGRPSRSTRGRAPDMYTTRRRGRTGASGPPCAYLNSKLISSPAASTNTGGPPYQGLVSQLL